MAAPTRGGLDGLITVLGGGTVCVAAPDGTITADRLTGVYFRDVRVLSQAVLRVDGSAPLLLSTAREGASTVRHVYVLAANDHNDPTAVLLHRRKVDGAVHDSFEVRVFAGRIAGLELTLQLATDFAPLLELKAGAPAPDDVPLQAVDAPDHTRRWHAGRAGTGVEIIAHSEWDGDGPDALRATIDADAASPWSATITVRPRTPDVQRRVGVPASTGDMDREHRATTALAVRSPTAWQPAIESALDDLSALHVHVPDMDLSYIAAGAPWFIALFGRDSLLTAWMSLLGGTGTALDVLDGLARYQGTTDNPATLEQPGRILHELRTGEDGTNSVPAGRPYYGTVDATPLFVMLLAETYRWGGDVERVRELLPAARAAVGWCLTDGDLDGDGFVEYVADDGGLANQGWKDSGDAMVHADGSLAQGPIALCEVQAYVYRALLDLARLETDLGDPSRATDLETQAAEMRSRFVDAFWLPDRGLIAMGLDGSKKPLAVMSSNAAHCLWAGILPDDIASEAARQIATSALITRWGVRTLAADERAFNPLSYHLGSIWPHDSAIAAAGLMRSGEIDAASALTDGLLAACNHFGWRLPELFGGFDRDQTCVPVDYPVACSPQAWSAATPLLLLRTMLRLDPDVPAGIVDVDPALSGETTLVVSGIGLGDGLLDLSMRGTATTATRAPDRLDIRITGRDDA